MKKSYLIICLAAAVLHVGVTRYTSEINKLQWSEQELKEELRIVYEENSSLREQLVAAKKRAVSEECTDSEEIDNPVENTDLSENEDVTIIDDVKLDQMDKGYAERIRSTMSTDDMVVLGVYAVGEDSEKSMKRFFLCDGRYYMECYLVDYITGEINNLSSRMPRKHISRYANDRDEDGHLVTVYDECEIRMEDYDSNGEQDILLVVSFSAVNWSNDRGSVLLWLQRDGEFLPINSEYYGNYMRGRNSEISLKIAELEGKFRKEQNTEEWSIDTVGRWVKGELLAGMTEELEMALQNPKKQIPYSQWREPRNLHPELMQDKEWHYSVRISENPYSEKKINEWLKAFYENDEEAEKEFMGVIREDEETLTEQERLDVGFYYVSSVWPTRVDDAVICLMTNVYAYSGGVHGNDFTHSVVFDTRSGEVLRLEDVVESEERFFDFALDYIEANDELDSWETEDMKESLRYEKWCFTDYGFKVFWNGMNGAGIYSREIPYELLADYLKEEYLPISRTAEYGLSYWEYNQTEGKILMDVNADGEVDTLIISVSEEEPIQLSINGTVSELDPQYQDELLSELKFRIQSAILERQEDGTTRLNLKVDFRSAKDERYYLYIFVYRIEGEDVILETEYEVEEEY